MKLSVHLVTWNGAKYIPYLFESLKMQTLKDWQLYILDNASSDNTVAEIEKVIKGLEVECKLEVNKENKGFAGGHNQLNDELRIKNYECDYILLLNQDMYLGEDCLEKMVKFLDKNEDVAVVSPRLMKWDFANKQFTNQIDTLGLKVLRSRQVIEKYAGKNWEEKKAKLELFHRTKGEAMEVFGVSGALPMYRRVVIDKVGLFDETFGSYKEDVDLAYRLRSAGYKAYVLLDTAAYHDRSALGVEKRGDRAALQNKKNQSAWVKYQSYKNHLMTLYKNEYWQNFLLDFIYIKWYEVKKFFCFLLFDRQVLKGLWEIWRLRQELKKKRKENFKLRKITWREMRQWFT